MLPACQTLQQVANLRKLDFSLERAADARLAGVELERIRSYEDLTARDVARLSSAAAQGEMPLQFDLYVAAENPEENDVRARLVEMDWTLLLEDRETVGGVVSENMVIDPGQRRSFPVRVELDLVEFFDGSARDLFELAMAAAGRGEPRNVSLRARPTVDTPLGPIQYPEPVTITSRTVGS